MIGLSTQQLASYEHDGFLVIENFAGREECERLRRRAEELVRDFDPRGGASIFSTREQTRVSDDYFLGSGDKIRFFLEEEAFAPDGGFRYAKERSTLVILHGLLPHLSYANRSAKSRHAYTLHVIDGACEYRS